MTGRVPAATYRLQFHAGFTFQDASAIVDYLDRLGVSHCYCSSYLQAVSGSPHGYDVADPTSLNAEIGTQDDYRMFVATLRDRGLGQILDVVPNHMGISRSSNPWWQDVLENGPSSRYAHVFDIDWQPVNPALRNKVLLPILGDQYGAVLERGEIVLRYRSGTFLLEYFETSLPIAPGSYPRILTHRIDELAATLGDDHPDVLELLSIVTSLERLPSRDELNPSSLAERQREKEVAKRRLSRLVDESDTIRRFVDRNIEIFNGNPGIAASFDRLDALVSEQSYRLAHWRVAAEEINYRRFFDINELAAVRMEDPRVFEEMHQLIFGLLAEGSIAGLRIDHVDGLYDPGDYLRRLQARARELGLGSGDRPLFVVVEKILAPDEPLPADWPVDGTTGYDFVNEVNGLFIDRMNARAFDEVYRRFTGDRTSFAETVYRSKKQITQIEMASEINVLAHRLNRLSEGNRHYRDFTLYSLVRAIREIVACFPVYRTYVSVASDRPVSERDRIYIDRAVNQAKRRNPASPTLTFDFIRDLLLKRAGYISDADREEYLRFVTQFQQLTSPVTAKGFEDTALYLYTRLASLNEVGGDPSRFGAPPAHVHEWMANRQRGWPSALSTTSTHDTKRSEDVRARIDALSELPGAWKLALARWAKANRRLKPVVDGQPAPDRHEEYLLYQTLVGAWPHEALNDPVEPSFCERICAYLIKALREAKRNTSWLNPRPAYEQAVISFIRKILDGDAGGAFQEELRPIARRLAHAGIWNSLAQVTIKVTAPGIPDFYQGTEIWDFSLVDPDNRRPVDFKRRLAMLDEIMPAGTRRVLDQSALEALVSQRLDGRIKLYTTVRALQVRRDAPDLFHHGSYVPLTASGARASHLFAFARINDAAASLTIVPRLTTSLVPDYETPPMGDAVWGDTHLTLPPELQASSLVNAFTGARLELGPDTRTVAINEVLGAFPVAILIAE